MPRLYGSQDGRRYQQLGDGAPQVKSDALEVKVLQA